MLSKKLGTGVMAALSLLLTQYCARGQNGNYNGFLWWANGTGATITGYTGPGGNVTIPSTVVRQITDPDTGIVTTVDYSVNAIGTIAFNMQASIQSMVVPDGVTSLGNQCFGGCVNMTSISLPNTVVFMGTDDFAACRNLKTVNLPSRITAIKDSTFNACLSLESVNIPAGVTSIEPRAFNGCESLKAISIPSGVTTIGFNAFTSCKSLTHIEIPPNVTSIDSEAFYGCTKLESVSLQANIPGISERLFYGCSSLKQITIPDGVTVIGSEAFRSCSGLTSVTFPSSLKSFPGNGIDFYNNDSFTGCTSLINVCFQGDYPYDRGAIFGGDPLSTIYYVNGTAGWSINGSFAGITTMPCFECGDPIKFAPEATGAVDKPINLNPSGKPNLALVIHGYTPPSKTPYSDAADMPALAAAIQQRLQADGVANQWDVRFFDWSSASGGSPIWAARNAQLIGRRTAQQILADGKYTGEVQLVSWSAGAWAANSIAVGLKDKSAISTSTTFLDSFIPDKFQKIFWGSESGNYPPSALGAGLSDVEQYYETLFGWGTGFEVSAVNHDITPLLNYPDKMLYGCFDFTGNPHAFPPSWYTYTVRNRGYNYGYQKRFNISGASDTLDCDDAEPLIAQQPQIQAQTLTSSAKLSRKLAVISEVEIPPMPTNIIPPHISRINSASMVVSQISRIQSLGSGSPTTLDSTNNPPASQYDSLTFLGAAVSLTNLNVVAEGGSGTISTNSAGLQLETPSFVWESFNLSLTNAANYGILEYSNTVPNDSVVTLWLDGQLIQAIESDTNCPLATSETFPLSKPIDAGNHILTVGLESLDSMPISTTIRNTGLHYIVNQPLITSQSVDTNRNFRFMWEAAAGLKYQPQYNNDLTSSDWLNIGGLLTSPTNAIMSAFNYIATNKQGFYRVGIEQ